MPKINAPLRASALLCFALADSVAAHPRPLQTLDGVRVIGAADAPAGADAYQSGKRLLASDDVAGALAAFREALLRLPASVDAMNGIGVCYDRLDRPDLAAKFYAAGLAIDPASPYLLNNLGYSRFLAGDFAGAIAPLRAAAVSSDPAIASAAAATLARLASPGTSTPAVAGSTAPAPATVSIEATSEGEQRLVFGGVDVVTAEAVPSEIAALVEVADTWTPADDATLIARVAAEEAAEQAARDSAARPATSFPPPAANVVLVAAATVAMPIPAVPSPKPGGHVIAVASIDEPQSEATTLRRRGASALRGATASAGEGSKRPGPQPFDSDDAELNAFAARVGSAMSAATAPAEPSRIAAQFRA